MDAPITLHPSVEIARAIGAGGKEASTSFAVICSNPVAELQQQEGAVEHGAPFAIILICLGLCELTIIRCAFCEQNHMLETSELTITRRVFRRQNRMLGTM